MTKTWTDAQIKWLRENYHAGTIEQTCAAFEREFGRRVLPHAMYVQAHRHGLHKDRHGDQRNVAAETRIRWSEPGFAEMREWMLENDEGESVFPTIEKFRDRFGITLNRSQVSRFRAAYGTKRRKSHGGGKPNKPVGSTRMGKDGYIMVKVAEWPSVPQSKDNWKFKHVLAWEQANGRELPKGHVVMFADHDKRNFDPKNLVAVPRKYIVRLNSPDMPDYHDRDTLLACMALIDLQSGIKDAENARRTCGVCGKAFTPTAKQRMYRHPVSTCPECLAAGKKARGPRGDGKPTVCAVCGSTFNRERADQRRCPECIAARPTHSVEKHAAAYARTGER